jgi:hypothetical protein
MAPSEGTPSRASWLSRFRQLSTDRESHEEKTGPAKWSLGVLNDKKTVEVPGRFSTRPYAVLDIGAKIA